MRVALAHDVWLPSRIDPTDDCCVLHSEWQIARVARVVVLCRRGSPRLNVYSIAGYGAAAAIAGCRDAQWACADGMRL